MGALDTAEQESHHLNGTSNGPIGPKFVRCGGAYLLGLRSLFTVVIGVACCSCTLLFSGDNTAQTDATDLPEVDAGVGEIPMQTQTIQIIDGTHDSLQDPNGDNKLNHGWISLYSTNHRGGLYFSISDIDSDTQIVAASLEVFADSETESSPNLRIYGELVRNPLPFTATINNLSDRETTIGYTEWVGISLGGGWHRSPDISAVIQEVVDTIPLGNRLQSLVFILDPVGQNEDRLFEIRQFDNSDQVLEKTSAKLILSYRPKS